MKELKEFATVILPVIVGYVTLAMIWVFVAVASYG